MGDNVKYEEFKNLSVKEQIEYVLMKHIFRSNDSDHTAMCNNLTIITKLNKNLLPEQISKIKYE